MRLYRRVYIIRLYRRIVKHVSHFFANKKGRFPVLIHQQAAARKFARLAPSRSRAARSLARRARRFRSGLLPFGSGSARRAGAGPRVLPEIVRQPPGVPLFFGRRRWLCRRCICIVSWRCASFFIPKIGRQHIDFSMIHRL